MHSIVFHDDDDASWPWPARAYAILEHRPERVSVRKFATLGRLCQFPVGTFSHLVQYLTPFVTLYYCTVVSPKSILPSWHTMNLSLAYSYHGTSILYGRLLPVLCNSASALDTSPLLWSTLRCHLREFKMRGDAKAQHLMISVVAWPPRATTPSAQIPRPLAQS
jgi:hypothetical protein